MASSRTVGGLLAAATTMALVVVVCPYVHNQFVHPLGRIEKSISFGDDCEEIRLKLAEYASASASDERQLSETVLRRRDDVGERGPQTYELFVYDLSPFDDLQLTVVCSYATDAVVYKFFFAD